MVVRFIRGKLVSVPVTDDKQCHIKLPAVQLLSESLWPVSES
jgi:hypothetical protein